MNPTPPNRLVHLELHTGDQPAACAFYAQLFGWRADPIATGNGTYCALELGGGVGGGIVQCETSRSLWLPYVEVRDVTAATSHARELAASVLLEPREGPVGWRSVIATPAGAEIAFWQPKR
jgi:predicted enzyme related to lactoylglutathione lyase